MAFCVLQVGPTIEMAYPQSIHEDEELCKILPFLALPDGAHLVNHPAHIDIDAQFTCAALQNEEDYSYFHIVPTKQAVFESQPVPPASPHTIFGIS